MQWLSAYYIYDTIIYVYIKHNCIYYVYNIIYNVIYMKYKNIISWDSCRNCYAILVLKYIGKSIGFI